MFFTSALYCFRSEESHSKSLLRSDHRDQSKPLVPYVKDGMHGEVSDLFGKSCGNRYHQETS